MTNRFYGKIGFVTSEEVKKGTWKDVIEEKTYRGNVISFRKSLENQSYSSNDNININAKISIIDDGHLSVNSSSIRYVEFMGTKWKVSDITPEYPRLILTLGGVYRDTNK